MTARWSGAVQSLAQAMEPRAVSKSNVGGFPTTLDRQSPKKVFPAGARDVNVGCRSEFEASCHRDQGTPQGDTRA